MMWGYGLDKEVYYGAVSRGLGHLIPHWDRSGRARETFEEVYGIPEPTGEILESLMMQRQAKRLAEREAQRAPQG